MPRADARSARIDAAEVLVAERGLAAMSLREVQGRAGQFNKNAAQYHFGNREGLIAAVIETRMGPINERPWQMLAELDHAASIRKLMEALIYPLAQAVLNNPSSHYARFLAQAFFDPQLSAMIVGHVRAGSSREALDRLIRNTRLPPIWSLRAPSGSSP
jgi:AcrR family transcriptional regulator